MTVIYAIAQYELRNAFVFIARLFPKTLISANTVMVLLAVTINDTLSMENIFIDTSIFIKENSLEGKRLQQLFKLGEEKQIQLVLTRVTTDEIN